MLQRQTFAEKPKLYKNNGDLTYSDVTAEAQLNKVFFAMGANFGDLNNDGFFDFYAGTGAPDLRSIIPNRMFVNRDGQRFDEVTFQGGFGHLQKGHGVAFADFNNDGQEDVYSVIGGAFEGDIFQNVLFENPGIGANNWVVLELKGSKANRRAIGARIRAVGSEEEGKPVIRYSRVTSGGSFGASPLDVHLGMGLAESIDTLTIQWPDAAHSTSQFLQLKLNTRYMIAQDSTTIVNLVPQPVYYNTDKNITHQHN